MRFDNKLIVSDIDGTFFDSDSQTVDRNIDALNYFKENGGFFTFATGRSEVTLEAEIIKFANVPLICCNGAYIYDAENQRKHNEICIAPGPVISMIKTVMAAFPGIAVRITADNKYYLVSASDSSDVYEPRLKSDFLIRTELENVPTEYWYKVVFCGDAEKLNLASKFISVKAENLYQLARSSPTMLELYNLKATKGLAALELKRTLEAKHGKINLYAIGDYENDIDLLEHADIAVCPENALPALKNIADTVVCTNSDGAIAGLIEYIDANS